MGNIFAINIMPPNEEERLEALKRYHIINTPQEAFFDLIVSLTAQTFDVPMALISLVDIDQVFFKASVGANGIERLPRNSSLCAIAILDTEPRIIHYAQEEECLLCNPIIAAEYGFKFYAAAPLITPDGFAIGALCITDTKERTFTNEQVQTLKDIANIVMQEIEKRLIQQEQTTLS